MDNHYKIDEPIKVDTTATITLTLTLSELQKLRMTMGNTVARQAVRADLPVEKQDEWRALDYKLDALFSEQIPRQEELADQYNVGYNEYLRDKALESKQYLQSWTSTAKRELDGPDQSFWQGYLDASEGKQL